jgi:hypothetical protein
MIVSRRLLPPPSRPCLARPACSLRNTPIYRLHAVPGPGAGSRPPARARDASAASFSSGAGAGRVPGSVGLIRWFVRLVARYQ